MDGIINEEAVLAVKRGISWLDENHPNWASHIDLVELNMSECEDCVIGQAIGDYTETIRNATEGEGRDADIVWAVEHGFEWPGVMVYQNETGKRSPSYNYRDLDRIWSEEVQSRLG